MVFTILYNMSPDYCSQHVGLVTLVLPSPSHVRFVSPQRFSPAAPSSWKLLSLGGLVLCWILNAPKIMFPREDTSRQPCLENHPPSHLPLQQVPPGALQVVLAEQPWYTNEAYVPIYVFLCQCVHWLLSAAVSHSPQGDVSFLRAGTQARCNTRSLRSTAVEWREKGKKKGDKMMEGGELQCNRQVFV